jgi:hypothetical protein
MTAPKQLMIIAFLYFAKNKKGNKEQEKEAINIQYT